MNLDKIKVYVTHGYDSNPSKNWFMWLRDELEKIGVKTHLLQMPNPSAPNPSEWLDSMRKQVNNVDCNTYFVGHSLGTLTTMHFLQNLDIDRIGGFILVSGFYKPVKGLENLNSFVEIKINFKKLQNITHKRLVICARNDNIVPASFSYDLAQELDSDVFQTSSGGHFMETEGYTKFPLILEQLNRFFKNLY